LQPATPEEQQAYVAVRTLYQKKAHEAAILKINAFIKKHPQSSLVGHMYNLGGLIYLSRKELANAQTAFERALRFSPEPVFDHYVQYNLATVHFEGKRYKEARTLLLAIQPSVLSAQNRLKYHFLCGAVHHKHKYTKRRVGMARAYSEYSRSISPDPGRGDFLSPRSADYCPHIGT
jgi:tetratricopeptide (TPR) repeat protein